MTIIFTPLTQRVYVYVNVKNDVLVHGRMFACTWSVSAWSRALSGDLEKCQRAAEGAFQPLGPPRNPASARKFTSQCTAPVLINRSFSQHRDQNNLQTIRNVYTFDVCISFTDIWLHGRCTPWIGPWDPTKGFGSLSAVSLKSITTRF